MQLDPPQTRLLQKKKAPGPGLGTLSSEAPMTYLLMHIYLLSEATSILKAICELFGYLS